MIADFAAASAVTRLDDTRFAVDIPDGWQQGRGAFGGLVLGALTRALEATAAMPAWPLRTLTAEIPSPVPVGAAEIEIETLRRSKSVAILSARLRREGETLARASAVFGAARGRAGALPPWNDLAPPTAPPWQEVAPSQMGASLTFPAFAQFYEYRSFGPLPLAGDGVGGALGYVRPRVLSGPLDAAALVGYADAFWPAPFSRLATLTPMSTVAFSLEVLAPLDGLSWARPLLHRATAPVCHDGFIVEVRELWDVETRRLVALNQQTFAVTG